MRVGTSDTPDWQTENGSLHLDWTGGVALYPFTTEKGTRSQNYPL
ncbi:MAG: hypothetical protein ACE5R6_02110 [Candidatus Heimdallarchaeota archaeon]